VRVILIRLLLLVLPVLVYLAWRYWSHRRALASGQPGLDLKEGPWLWLILAGAALAIGSLVLLRLTAGEPPGGAYVPPRLEDGRIIPGHIDR